MVPSPPNVRSFIFSWQWVEDTPVGISSVDLSITATLKSEASLEIVSGSASCLPRRDARYVRKVFDDAAVVVNFDAETGDLCGLELNQANKAGGPTFDEFSAYLTSGEDIRAGSLMLSLNRLWLAVDAVLHYHAVVISEMLEREPFPDAELLLWMNRFLVANDAVVPLRPKTRLSSIARSRSPS